MDEVPRDSQDPQGAEHDLAKGQWHGARKKGHTNKTLRTALPPPPPDVHVAQEQPKSKAQQWELVQRKKTRKKKEPSVAAGYQIDKSKNKFVAINRERNETVYTGMPSSRQNRIEHVIKSELQERSLTDQKLVYVSRYNKRPEKNLQRR